MPQVTGKLDAIMDVWISQNGDTTRINLSIGEQGSVDLELSPESLLALRAAVEHAQQQSETKRDATASSGHPSPHPFLPIQRTMPLQVFVPDRVGVRAIFRNGAPLDFLLTLDGARALRDQLDASLAAACRPEGAPH